MFVWYGPVSVKCSAHSQGDVSHASGQYYGSETNHQYSALWHVFFYGQPNSNRGYGGGHGRFDPHALYAGPDAALGSWKPYGFNRRQSGSEQHFKTDVHVGRRDPDYQSWYDEYPGYVIKQ